MKKRKEKYIRKKWNKQRETMMGINQEFYMSFDTVIAQLSAMAKGDKEI